MAYLSIDIGTSTVKAGLISEDGRLIGSARRSVMLSHGDGPNEHESDPADWILAVSQTLSEALRGQERPRAIAISGNGPTLLAVDSQGNPIGKALSWMDRRAVREAEEVSALAGKKIDASFYLPKALYLFRSSAEVREKARYFFSCPEFLLYFLTGEACTYLPDKGYLPYIWSPEFIKGVGLPQALFPPFASPGSLVGKTREGLFEGFSLPEGVPAAAGFPDFLASLVGSGVIHPGLVGDRGGTSEAINICAGQPFPQRELLSLPHAITGLWNISGGLSTAGKALEWFARCGGYSGLGADSLFAEAQRSPPGARGAIFLPYLAGERAPLWDSNRRGAFFGLSLTQGREDLARAACESLCFGLKLPLEIAKKEGFALLGVRASGATARNDFLCALKADILGLPLEVPAVADSELMGDACAAAFALGDCSSLAEASAALVRIAARFEPDRRFIARYSERFELFKEALAALGPIDAKAAGFAEAAATASAAVDIVKE